MKIDKKNKDWPSSHAFGSIDQRLLNQEPVEPQEPPQPPSKPPRPHDEERGDT